LRVVGLADSGHLTLQVERCDLAAGIRDVLALSEPGLRAKGLLPELRLDDALVECDPARMRQALLALLENARCHAAPGRLEIGLACSGGECRLAVTDSGPGIDQAFASKLFDAFQRGDAARLQGGSGSGLGLAVVRAIALAHGGEARCHAVGGGTCFELAWPSQAGAGRVDGAAVHATPGRPA